MGPKMDVFEFKGAKAMSQTISGTALSDQSDSYESGAVRITCTAHGYLAGSLIYLTGFVSPLTYLNGLKKILAVATNTFDVAVKQGKYAAGTPGGTETARVACSLDEDFLYEGFSFDLTVVAANTEDLEVVVDADKGAEFDSKIFDQDTNGTKNITNKEPAGEKIDLKANDLVVATWANAGSKTWGFRFLLRRKS